VAWGLAMVEQLLCVSSPGGLGTRHLLHELDSLWDAVPSRRVDSTLRSSACDLSRQWCDALTDWGRADVSMCVARCIVVAMVVRVAHRLLSGRCFIMGALTKETAGAI